MKNSCEVFPDGHPEDCIGLLEGPHMRLNMLIDDTSSLFSDWTYAVEFYSKAQLTYGSDKLVALAGIAQAVKHVAHLLDEDYLAGLWRPLLVEGLLWGGQDTRRSQKYRAPSWSWASVDGLVCFHISNFIKLVTVLNGSTVPIGSAFGPVSDGRLTLSGPLLSIRLRNPIRDRADGFKASIEGCFENVLESGISEASKLSILRVEVALDHDPQYDDWPTDGRQLHFACLVCDEYTRRPMGLVVEPAKGRKNGYVRIGFMHVDLLALKMPIFEKHKTTYTLY